MRLLLDTHALFWWQNGNPRLPATVREAIAAEDVFYSGISLYELALKSGRGKLSIEPDLFADFAAQISEQGFGELPLSAAHAIRAGQLDFSHRDPFDRMLISQALVEKLTIVSNEKLFDQTGVDRLWA